MDLFLLSTLAQLAATWALVGLIWHVQLVQYPLFRNVGRQAFLRYHELHTRRISWVVGPLMLVELTSAIVVTFGRHDASMSLSDGVALALLGVVWLSTIFLQVPDHRRLSLGFSPEHHRRLVLTNWIRTASWSARGVLVLYSFEGQVSP